MVSVFMYQNIWRLSFCTSFCLSVSPAVQYGSYFVFRILLYMYFYICLFRNESSSTSHFVRGSVCLSVCLYVCMYVCIILTPLPSHTLEKREKRQTDKQMKITKMKKWKKWKKMKKMKNLWKITMCIFWFYFGQVRRPGQHGQVDFSVLIKIIEHNILILYSGQVGRPGRRGQVVF